MSNLLRLSFLPSNWDCALLALRIWIGATLLLNHGWSKLVHFSTMSSRFGDPLHIGHPLSLALAVLCEVFCALLVIIGFATRLAALFIIIELGVAFIFVHHLRLSGPGNGELPFIYIAGFVAIFLAGPGRFSVDQKA